jgi:hypothetical protein
VFLQVTDHARQLLEKHLGLPFLNAGYSGPAPRMNLQQVCFSSWRHVLAGSSNRTTLYYTSAPLHGTLHEQQYLAV